MSPSPTPPLGPPPRTHRRLRIGATKAAVAHTCAVEIARLVRDAAIADNPALSIAFSGGTTPSEMFRSLATCIADDPVTAAGWERTHVFQVDERIVPDGDPQRNANDLVALLLDPTGVDLGRRHLMPVTRPGAASLYERTLGRIAPSGLDVVVLGLGEDGHTASLVPGDTVLEITDTPVAVSGVYRGTRRLTLTRATLDAATLVIWLITGATKADPLRRLMDGDRTIPAGLVDAPQQIVFADREAASLVTDRAD